MALAQTLNVVTVGSIYNIFRPSQYVRNVLSQFLILILEYPILTNCTTLTSITYGRKMDQDDVCNQMFRAHLITMIGKSLCQTDTGTTESPPSRRWVTSCYLKFPISGGGGGNRLNFGIIQCPRLSLTLDDPPEISCKDLAKIAYIREYLQERSYPASTEKFLHKPALKIHTSFGSGFKENLGSHHLKSKIWFIF